MNLPAWLTSLLTTVLLPLAKLVGKNGLVEMFKNMKTKNQNTYISVITIGYRVLKVHVLPLANTTATEWDNEAIDIVLSAIEKSAADNSVVLPDVTIHAVALPLVTP